MNAQIKDTDNIGITIQIEPLKDKHNKIEAHQNDKKELCTFIKSQRGNCVIVLVIFIVIMALVGLGIMLKIIISTFYHE